MYTLQLFCSFSSSLSYYWVSYRKTQMNFLTNLIYIKRSDRQCLWIMEVDQPQILLANGRPRRPVTQFQSTSQGLRTRSSNDMSSNPRAGGDQNFSSVFQVSEVSSQSGFLFSSALQLIGGGPLTLWRESALLSLLIQILISLKLPQSHLQNDA